MTFQLSMLIDVLHVGRYSHHGQYRTYDILKTDEMVYDGE